MTVFIDPLCERIISRRQCDLAEYYGLEMLGEVESICGLAAMTEGHVDKRRFIAAVNCMARRVWEFYDGLGMDPGAYAWNLARVRHCWGNYVERFDYVPDPRRSESDLGDMDWNITLRPLPGSVLVTVWFEDWNPYWPPEVVEAISGAATPN